MEILLQESMSRTTKLKSITPLCNPTCVPYRHTLMKFIGSTCCHFKCHLTENSACTDWNCIYFIYLSQKKKSIISICLYPFRLFEVFYNYRPDRADKWCWRGVRPSGRQKGIVLAEVKMENIKRYSTDDCNLTKPLQGYLTRHIKQGEGFLESKTMTTWLSGGSISVFLFLALIITHKACQRDNKLQVLRSAGRRDLRIDIAKEGKKIWDSHSWSWCYSAALSAYKHHWCAMNQTRSTCSTRFTQGPKNAKPERRHISSPTASQRQERKVTLSANFACIQKGVKEKRQSCTSHTHTCTHTHAHTHI